MHAPYVNEYTDHLVGAPKRRTWPMLLLLPVMATAAIAGVAFIMLVLSLVITP